MIKKLSENNNKIKNIIKQHQMQCNICGSIFHKVNKNKHLQIINIKNVNIVG